jgi:hypothetical protein
MRSRDSPPHGKLLARSYVVHHFTTDIGERRPDLAQDVIDLCPSDYSARHCRIVGTEVRDQEFIENLEATTIPAFVVAPLNNGQELLCCHERGRFGHNAAILR